jgi:thymidylate synthase (FAD)|tara:strand:- start:44 stop:670 length:627 start_codon:yes stop_codon:yes gene_type:complete
MQNKIELLGYYGSDDTHACSAWTSTSRELSAEKIERIPKLLKYLADHKHETPFEKSGLHFLVDCDIASHIHILKHRVGVSVNAESARYKELREDKILIPHDLPLEWQRELANFAKEGMSHYHACIKDLINKFNFSKERAKEVARYFRTYNTQITSDVMFNFRSFVHFLNLRNKPDAQKEIREIAQNMLDLVKKIDDNPFEHTITAFNL